MDHFSSSTRTSSACFQEEMLEMIAATCHRETTAYGVVDWLHNDSPEAERRPLHTDAPDRDCRSKTVAWCERLVDFCQLSRETVEITTSLLDRFVCTSRGANARNDRLTFQLACMAALYTAIKIHEPMAMSPQMMAQFSHGLFTSSDIEDMESTLLDALQWRVNPPTSWDFIRMLMDLLSTSEQLSLNHELRSVVSDLAIYQAQLAVANDLCITVKASTLAYAAIINALESVEADQRSMEFVGHCLARSLQLECDAQDVKLLRSILNESTAKAQHQDANLCRRLQLAKVHSTNWSRNLGSCNETSVVETSPRAVSQAR